MLRKLSKCIREYKKPTILTLFFIIVEAVIETFIPFITADMVNAIKAGATTKEVLSNGALLIVLAVASLTCGGFAGFTCARVCRLCQKRAS